MQEMSRFQRLKAIYQAVSALEPAARQERLHDQCGGDPALYAEVTALLEAEACSQGFLNDPGPAVALLAEPTLLHPRSIGRYRVLRLLGEGGMGAVYEAEQDQPVRRVAVKIMRTGLSMAQHHKRFEHEIQILGRLQHPGIARILEAGTAEAIYAGGLSTRIQYIAMELIEGKPLLEYARTRSLTDSENIELFTRICDAVHHGHQRGVIHRDLKPANVLVVDPAQPKIIDFGVARLTDTEDALSTLHTEAGRMLGTVQYMSPEQVSGNSTNVDVRSDIYSMGVIGFELLCGRLPHAFPDRSLPTMAHQIATTEPARLGSVAPHLRGDLEVILAKALAREPDQRYASAHELAEDLRRYLTQQPILARPPSALYVLHKFARRHRHLVAGLAMIAVVLLVGIAVTTSAMLRATRAESDMREHSLRREHLNQVMREILTYARPGLADGGRDARVVDMLNKASQGLSERLAEVPDVEQEIQDVLGETYFRLGLYPEADQHMGRAHALAIQLYGENSPAALKLAAVQGLRRTYSVRTAWDHQVHKQVIAMCRDKLEVLRYVSHKDASCSEAERYLRFALARALWTLYRAREAEPEYRWIVDTLQESQSDAAMLCAARIGLARCLHFIGRLDESIAMARAAVSEDRDTLDPIWEVDSLAEGHLAFLIAHNGHLDEAVRLCQSALVRQRAVLGDDHPNSVDTKRGLIGLLLRLRRFEEALALTKEVHAYYASRRPDDDGYFHHYKGNLLGRLNRLDEARAEYQASIDAFLKYHPPDNILNTSVWHAAVMELGLGFQQSWNSEVIRQHVWQAIGDALLTFIPRTLDIDDVVWGELTFALRQWECRGDAADSAPFLSTVVAGDLTDLRSLVDPEPGLYRLDLAVPRLSCASLATTVWVLASPWGMIAFHTFHNLEDGTFRHFQRGTVEERTSNTLALQSTYGDAIGSFGAITNFEIHGTTRFQVPPGLYQLALQTDDGVRIWLDGQLVIDRWRLYDERATAEVDLSAREHEIRLEYFQNSGESRVWLQLVPAGI